MKKIHVLTCLGFTISSYFLQAQVIISSGQTLTVPSNTSMPFPDGVLILDGGKLKIESGAYVGVGVDKSIRVEDGGVIEGFNATISVIHEALPGKWKGVQFNGSSVAVTALKMTGGAIRRADIAINMTLQGFRKVECTATTFQDNNYHMIAQTGAAPSFNGTKFTSCYFLKATGTAPILIAQMNGIEFKGCFFHYQSVTHNRMIHIDHPMNVLIDDCTFIYFRNAISFHFNIQSSTISNCEFYFDEGYTSSASADVIQLGVEVSSSSNGVSILNNKLYGNNKGQIGYGIRVLYCYNQNTSITGNQIGIGGSYAFNDGIYIKDADEGSNVINENVIEGCGNGIHTAGGNGELAIVCNLLQNNGTHWRNDGQVSDQSPNGLNPGNHFIGAKGYDIFNSYSQPITYYTLNYVSINAHPPLIIFGVQFEFVNLEVGCEIQVGGGGHGGEFKDGETESREGGSTPLTALSVFPNPASDIVNGMVSLDVERSVKVTILDMTGQVLMEQQIMGTQQVSFEISTLPEGMYLFSVLKDGGEPVTKRFSVIR